MNAKTRALVESDFVGVADAAKRIGLSNSRVYELIESGALSHAIVGGKKVVPLQAIFEYKAQRLVVGTVA